MTKKTFKGFVAMLMIIILTLVAPAVLFAAPANDNALQYESGTGGVENSNDAAYAGALIAGNEGDESSDDAGNTAYTGSLIGDGSGPGMIVIGVVVVAIIIMIGALVYKKRRK